MFQRIADQVVLSFFSLLYSGAVRLLRLRRDPLTVQRTTQPGAAGSWESPGKPGPAPGAVR